MSVCQTLTVAGNNGLSTSTSLIPNLITITAPPSTRTTSIPIISSSCVTPIPILTCGLGNNSSCPVLAPICSSTTTFSVTTEILPGTTSISTSFSTSLTTLTSLGSSTLTTCSLIPTTPITTTPITSPTTAILPITTSRVNTPSPTTNPTSSTTSVGLIIPPTSVNLDSTITSFSTFIITSTAANGQVEISTATSIGIIQPNTSSNSNSNGPNPGAIAGGVIGGVLLLLLILAGIWFARKKGYFNGSGDDQFDDDMWAPQGHNGTTGITGVPLAGGIGDDEEEQIRSNNGVGPGGMGNGDMSEINGPYTRPQSWQSQGSQGGMGSGNGHYYEPQGQGYTPNYGGRPVEFGIVPVLAAGAEGVHRAHSNSASQVSRQNSAGGGGGGGESSNGHEIYSYHGSPQSFSSPTFNNNNSPRLGSPQQPQQQTFYPNQALSYNRPQQDSIRQNEFLSHPTSSSTGHSESAKTTATTGSSVGLGNSLPLDRYEEQQHRPPLEVIPGSITSSSSNNSNSSGSGSNPPHSAIHSLFTNANHPNNSPPGSPNTSTGSHNNSNNNKEGEGIGLKRQSSVESLLAPSQFLGARIVNASTTPKEEKSGMDFNLSSAPQTHTITV